MLPLQKILLVDDDAGLRKAIARTLTMAGHEVVQASNGQQALDYLSLHPIGLIISDVRMPQMHGIELFHRARKTHTNIPFIMMTGFADIIDAAEAIRLGVSDFIPKPFTTEKILSAVKKVFEVQNPSEQLVVGDRCQNVQDYSPIEIGNFISGSQISYPIYIKISESKFVMLAHQGEDLDVGRIETLRQKGMEYLYLKNDDFKSYVDFNLKISDSVAKSKNLSGEQKTLFFKNTSELILQYGFQNEISPTLFSAAQKTVEQTLSMISAEPKLFDLLDKLLTNSRTLYGHSLGVALITSLMANKMGWISSKSMYVVMTASLYHDIGLTKIPQACLQKTEEDMNDQERAQYQRHPIMSAEMLRTILKERAEQDSLATIVSQHHERSSGRGFPLGLSKDKTHPLARLIGVADYFLGITKGGDIKRGHCLPTKQAIKKIQEDRASYGGEFVDCLASLFE